MRSMAETKVEYHVREEWSESDAFAQTGAWYEDEIDKARKARDQIAAATNADRVFLVRSRTVWSYIEDEVFEDEARVPAEAVISISDEASTSRTGPTSSRTPRRATRPEHTAVVINDGRLDHFTCSCGVADTGWGRPETALAPEEATSR